MAAEQQSAESDTEHEENRSNDRSKEGSHVECWHTPK